MLDRSVNGRSIFARKFTYLWVEPVGSLGDLSKVYIGQTAQGLPGVESKYLGGKRISRAHGAKGVPLEAGQVGDH